VKRHHANGLYWLCPIAFWSFFYNCHPALPNFQGILTLQLKESDLLLNLHDNHSCRIILEIITRVSFWEVAQSIEFMFIFLIDNQKQLQMKNN